MMDRLTGKTAVVTGAAGGIGTAVVKRLLSEGARVAAVCHKSRGELDSLDQGMLGIYQMDVCDPLSVKEASDRILREMGDPEILVNNAGISDSALFFAMEDDVWDRVIRTNLYGTRNVTRQFLMSMVRLRRGSIVNVSSVNGIMGSPGQSNYCAAKAGVIGMTRALAREMASRNIRVNAVAPGYIDTDMVREIPEKQRELFRKGVPMGRFGRPEEAAGAVAFLASEDAAYITGQVLVVDGGLSS